MSMVSNMLHGQWWSCVGGEGVGGEGVGGEGHS